MGQPQESILLDALVVVLTRRKPAARATADLC